MATLGEKVKIKVGDVLRTFTKESCSTTKVTAMAAAQKYRADTGKTARVLESDGKFCVYSGAKAKAKGAKKK